MSARLGIDIETQPFERLVADVAIAGVCLGDRPLRGGAARADWRLCGLISRLLVDERISGQAGEALLVPSDARLRAPRLLVIGLGPRSARKVPEVHAIVRGALDRVVGLGLESAALGPLGFTGDDWPRHAQAIVDAGFGAVESTGRALDLRLAVPGPAEARVRASIGAVIDAMGHPGVRLRRRDDRQAEGAAPRRRVAPQGSAQLHRTP